MHTSTATNRLDNLYASQNIIQSLESTSDHIWQIHNKYLITEIKSGLIIID